VKSSIFAVVGKAAALAVAAGLAAAPRVAGAAGSAGPGTAAAAPAAPAAAGAPKLRTAKTFEELLALATPLEGERALLDAVLADCDKAEPGSPVFACRAAQAKALETVLVLADRPYKGTAAAGTVAVAVDGSFARAGLMGGPFFTVGTPKTLEGPEPAKGVGLTAPGLSALATKVKAKTPAEAEKWAAGGLQVDLLIQPVRSWGVAHKGSWFSGVDVAVVGWRVVDRATGAVLASKPASKPGARVETAAVKAAALAEACGRSADEGKVEAAKKACDAAAALDAASPGLAAARAKLVKAGVAAEEKLCAWASTRDDYWFAYEKCAAVLALDPENADAKAGMAAIKKKGLEPSEVKDVMKKAMSKLAKCGASGAGKLTLLFKIRGDGVPQEVAVKPPDDETAAGKCVIEAMKKVKFPAFGAAASELVTWPLELF